MKAEKSAYQDANVIVMVFPLSVLQKRKQPGILDNSFPLMKFELFKHIHIFDIL